MNPLRIPDRLLRMLLSGLILLGLMGCTVRIQTGANQWDINLGATVTTQPTYTSIPSNTPLPTNTPRATYTPVPSLTLLPTYTHAPSITALPTATTKPTSKTPGSATSAGILIPTAGAGEISQFAKTASASTQYSTSGYSSNQATGAPNTAVCGDNTTAWASKASDTVDWLLLTYDQPVIPTRIIIYQSYHPGAVSLVEVVDDAGKSTSVYQATAAASSACPAKLEITVKDITTPVRSLRVTVNQTKHNGWAEIDAVQLVGKLK